MKKGMIIALLATTLSAQAQTTIISEKTCGEPVRWESNKSNPAALAGSDVVSIQNGTGSPIRIIIHVDKASAGINIKNCGSTSNITAGSTGICDTSDAINPVSFNSADPNLPARGTYEIRSQ